jgi:cyclophilin family peptidyl-prolyl cis-trans isomerase
VGNFLEYVRAGRYEGTFFHRSTTINPESIQIVQGGGFGISGNSIFPVETNPPIALETGPANRRGTIAMARTTDPNSATSQWYFNVTDNPGLDFNYAVFGRVVGEEGLAVLDAIGGVPVYDASPQLGAVFRELPLTEPALVVSSLVMVESVREIGLGISSAGMGEEGFRIAWWTVPAGLPARVLRCENLSAGDWVEVAAGITGGEFTDAEPPSGRGFYSVVYP